MYGLPSPSSGSTCKEFLAVGAFVVYEGHLRAKWGRYRVVAVAEHHSGARYDLASYHDDTVVLHGAGRRSIAAIPAGAPHRVLDPIERIDAVLALRSQAEAALAIDPQLTLTVLNLLSVARFVEAEVRLSHAELAAGVLSLTAFRHRIEHLVIRGNDESYL
jgi:hypothetical protein